MVSEVGLAYQSPPPPYLSRAICVCAERELRIENCDGLETLGEDFGYLVGAEIPFGADEDEGVGAGGVELAEGVALIARAVADVFLRIEN